MSSCNGTATSHQYGHTIDLAKRVKYNLGLVLGVDEFEQEQSFFLEQDRQHHRALHGYGTICGLRLTATGLDVFVSAGIAVNPQGKVIRVTRDQCANLGDWIDAGDHRAQLVQCYGAPPIRSSLYVLLCYRECESDMVPVPGAPCRTEEDTLAASRVTETFELRLSPHPPRADEEEAVRVFGDLLRQIEIVDPSPLQSPITDVIAEVEARVRALPTLLSPGGWPADPCAVLDSPLGSPLDSPLGSPLDLAPLVVSREDAPEALRAAFRIWATEVRPSLLAGRNCALTPPDERCVLLGELQFDLRLDGTIDPATLIIAQDERPILLHSRLLQEWLPGGLDVIGAQGPAQPVVLAGDASGPAAGTTVGGLQGTPVAATAPVVGDVLTGVADLLAPGGVRWAPQPVTGGQTNSPLAGDVSGAIGNNTVDRVRNVLVEPVAPLAGQVLTAAVDAGGQVLWRPVTPVAPPLPPVNLGGDVSGPAGGNQIDRLQGVPVEALPSAISLGDVLTAVDDGSGSPVWRPAQSSTPPGGNFIVAAGRFRGSGSSVFNFNGLTTTQFNSRPILYFVEFPDFTRDANFVVKGTPVTLVSELPHTVELLSIEEDDELQELIEREGFESDKGLVIRVTDRNQEEPPKLGFMLEISLFP